MHGRHNNLLADVVPVVVEASGAENHVMHGSPMELLAIVVKNVIPDVVIPDLRICRPEELLPIVANFISVNFQTWVQPPPALETI